MPPLSRSVAFILLIVPVWLAALFFSYCVHGAEIPREALRYRADLIRTAHVVWGLDAPVAVFAGQLHQESRWRSDAVSRVGARGMAQFMPATAAWVSGIDPRLAANDPTNPQWAIRALVIYNRHLWDRSDARDACNRMAITLAKYNGGETRLQREIGMAQAAGDDPLLWFDNIEKHNAGRSFGNFTENRSYPRRILLELAPQYHEAGFPGALCAS